MPSSPTLFVPLVSPRSVGNANFKIGPQAAFSLWPLEQLAMRRPTVRSMSAPRTLTLSRIWHFQLRVEFRAAALSPNWASLLTAVDEHSGINDHRLALRAGHRRAVVGHVSRLVATTISIELPVSIGERVERE
jgi:hypothetical protein